MAGSHFLYFQDALGVQSAPSEGSAKLGAVLKAGIPADPQQLLLAVSPELLADVFCVFGDEEKARRWLLTPRGVFEGRSPAQMATSPEGEALVREILTRIEHGIFS